MAFIHSPKIVTDGLILAADAGNTKSYVSGSTIWVDLLARTNGTLLNGPTFDSGSGGSIVFDGVDDYALFTTSSVFSTIQTNNSLTLSIFFKNNFTGSFRDLVGISKVSGQNPFVIRQGSNDVLFYDTSVGGTRYNAVITSPSSSNNVWAQACATFGNNQIRTYLNGNLVQTTNTTGNIDSFTSNVFGIIGIGYSNYKGSVSNFQLYNRALSATEVLQNYNATKGRFGL